MPVTTPSGPAEPLDYWTFVARAQQVIPERVPDADMAANRLVLSINRAASLVTYDLEASVHRPRGLSWAAFRLLFTLWVAGPLPAHQAAALSGMTRAGLSNLSGSLVERGLVSKAAATRDRRAVTLGLTDAGDALVTEVFADENARERQWAGVLTADEQETLAGLLAKVMAGRRSIGAARRH